MAWLNWGRRPFHWAIGVVISPKGEQAFTSTVDELLRAGWEQPYLFSDGALNVPERFADLPYVVREPPVGGWPHYYLALAELTMRHPAADAYVLAQGDASFGEFDRGALEQEHRSGEALVSIANSGGLAALVYPRRLAQDFLVDEVVCRQGWDPRLDLEDAIREWLQRRRIPLRAGSVSDGA